MISKTTIRSVASNSAASADNSKYAYASIMAAAAGVATVYAAASTNCSARDPQLEREFGLSKGQKENMDVTISSLSDASSVADDATSSSSIKEQILSQVMNASVQNVEGSFPVAASPDVAPDDMTENENKLEQAAKVWRRSAHACETFASNHLCLCA